MLTGRVVRSLRSELNTRPPPPGNPVCCGPMAGPTHRLHEQSLHSLIASRSRHSPVDELAQPFDAPFSPASTVDTAGWDAHTDRSDSPSMYSRAEMSPRARAAGSVSPRYEDGEYDVGEFNGDSTRTRGRTRTNSTLMGPHTRHDSPATTFVDNHSPQPSLLSPKLNSDINPRLSYEDGSSRDGSIDSSRPSLEHQLDDALGPKLRFGEKAPWELDSPFTIPTTIAANARGDDDGRRPSLASTLDSEPMSTSSSTFSFRGAPGGASKSSLRTRSRSATSAAAGVLKGFGGLVASSWGGQADRNKSANRDAEDGWAALGLGLEPTDPSGGLRKKVSSETVMLGADLARPYERDPSTAEVSGKRSFSSLRIGRSSPTPSRANSVYSTASVYSASGTIHPGSAASSPQRTIPPVPTPRTPHSLSPNTNTTEQDSPRSDVTPLSPGFINNTRHHGLISLGEAQARQRDRAARSGPSANRGAGGLPSPSPSPEPSHAKSRSRALTGGSAIKESSSDASVSSTDSLDVVPSRSRRMSAKFPSVPSFTEHVFTAPPIPLPTPPKSSLRNKKSIGGVGGLMKMFNKSSAASVVPPLPSPPPSATRPTVSAASAERAEYFYTPHSRTPSGAHVSSPPATSSASVAKPADASQALGDPGSGFSSLSNPFRTKAAPSNLNIAPHLPKSDSTESNAALYPREELVPIAHRPVASAPFPNLKLRPVSTAFSSGLPQAYLSSPPPPLPTSSAAAGLHPFFDVASLLRPPPSPSASSFTTAYSSASSSNQFSGSSVMEAGGSPGSATKPELLPPSSAAAEGEKDLIIKRLQEMLINERKVWRIQTCEYEVSSSFCTFLLFLLSLLAFV